MGGGGWGVIDVVTVNAFTTVRSTEVGGMWRIITFMQCSYIGAEGLIPAFYQR